MPGHKGRGSTVAPLDITEIPGADSLFEATGILAESEINAGAIFGARTFYSTEGASLAIRAMLYLAALDAKEKGLAPRILAGRNAHRVFLSAVTLLDLPVSWLMPSGGSYLSCPLTADEVAEALDRDSTVTALYLTSPDYLGNTVDIEAIAAVCRQHHVLLLVDNAHGAYLKFLPESRHPMDLGADLCCDSAHKTLPALTGAAYLHIRKDVSPTVAERAKSALALFGSTSPSYPILASLDALNPRLAGELPEATAETVRQVSALKAALTAAGYDLAGDEPLKVTLCPKSYGYRGDELAAYLQEKGIVAEFADPDHLTLMPSVMTEAWELQRVAEALTALPRRAPQTEAPPPLPLPETVMTPREAMLSPEERLPVALCRGRTLAAVTVGCPPAVPIAVSGERITAAHLEAFAYYSITHCSVVKEFG